MYDRGCECENVVYLVKQYDWFFASEDLLIITVIWHQIFIEPSAVETNMSFPLKTMMLKTFVCVCEVKCYIKNLKSHGKILSKV